MLQGRGELDPVRLEQAVASLLQRHDALRLRFFPSESGWRQALAAVEGPAPFLRIDLATLPKAACGRARKAAADQLRWSLDLARGDLFRAALLSSGKGGPDHLLLAAHPLAVDGSSWRILLEDLEMACGQRSRGEAIELPARTASFRQWAGWLAERAEALWQPESSETWLAQARRRSKDSLPVDGERLDEGPADTVSVWLSVEETQSLLSDALRAYRTEVNDGLLTALAQTFAAWTGEPALLVDLERSAREGAFEGLDLSRTVGCLAIVAPVLLHLGGAHGPGESLKAVKEQVRRLPEWGIGYGLLRYLSPDGETATRMRDLPQAEVIFRGPDLPGGTVPVPSLFAPTPSPAMARLARGLRVVPPYRLEVDCEIVAGRLRAVWTYGRQVYRRSTIEASPRVSPPRYARSWSTVSTRERLAIRLSTSRGSRSASGSWTVWSRAGAARRGEIS